MSINFFWCIFACCLHFSALSILANVRLEPVILTHCANILLSFDRQLQGWFLSVIVQISVIIIVGFNSHSLFTSGVNSQDGIFSFLLLEFSICIVIQLKPEENNNRWSEYNRFARFFFFLSTFFSAESYKAASRQFCQ